MVGVLACGELPHIQPAHDSSLGRIRRFPPGPLPPTSPQRAIKLCFLLTRLGTTSRQIPARASTNQGSEKGDLVPMTLRVGGLVDFHPAPCRRDEPF